MILYFSTKLQRLAFQTKDSRTGATFEELLLRYRRYSSDFQQVKDGELVGCNEQKIREQIAAKLFPKYTPEEQLVLLDMRFNDLKTEEIPFEGIIEI